MLVSHILIELDVINVVMSFYQFDDYNLDLLDILEGWLVLLMIRTMNLSTSMINIYINGLIANYSLVPLFVKLADDLSLIIDAI